ncbi:acetate kinase [Anaerovoracaceae bacterium 41-7]|jgi:acetate kinase|uniref:Acetate kinase n=1 Tax=Anaerotruncus colihominis TaxID=169435 RepID=A0A845QHZ4_9FIRM|nr:MULTISPECIES: acetate kinase [Clostridia]MCI9475426.1 acetate kinase [Emergencia sp.]MCI9639537.1 acetate kinase [Emergencia sp.]NBH61074.1 acetate kinase [Anaerotruncus colihominis]NCE98883.1 acetate kinase [Emergencia sp. 1XD21-10]NCF01729.1 acetate kinase [Anaerotruncus sp. 80]
MKVLVINCGSSSLKYQVLDMTNESLLAKGLVERIGMDGSVITHEKIGMDKVKTEVPMNDHKDAIKQVLDAIQSPEYGVIASMDEIGAVGHRVVHAGEKFADSVIIDDAVIAALEECVELAPLHNTPNLYGIAACKELMPNTPMVGVFDTAFHQTMPPEAYLYAIPYEYYEKHGIRRYGFHGTSHKYVAQRAASMLNVNINDLKLITCHLGNGASVSAIKHGRCIDTSMGFTPLEGLVMGTRCGDIDPAIVTYIRQKENLPQGVTNEILNKKSGVLGISGVSSDFRDLEDAVAEGNERAALALKVFARKVRFYIGAYIAEMNGVDAIVFTAGVGENDVNMRELICTDLGNLGIKLDIIKNKVRGKETIVSTEDSKVKLLLIPTNEELMIARDTYNLTKKYAK